MWKGLSGLYLVLQCLYKLYTSITVHVGVVEEMMCIVCVDVTEGA